MTGLELKVTHLDENKNLVSLDELREGKAMVLDFWHTKCVKCPAALEKLNEEAEERDDVLFVACALSQGEGNMEAVEDLKLKVEVMVLEVLVVAEMVVAVKQDIILIG